MGEKSTDQGSVFKRLLAFLENAEPSADKKNSAVNIEDAEQTFPPAEVWQRRDGKHGKGR